MTRRTTTYPEPDRPLAPTRPTWPRAGGARLLPEERLLGAAGNALANPAGMRAAIARRRCPGSRPVKDEKMRAWVGSSTTPWKPSSAKTQKNSRTSSTRPFVNPDRQSPKLADLIALFSDTDFHATEEYRASRWTSKAKTSSATFTNTSSASSHWPKARRAASTTRPRPIVTLIVKCCSPSRAGVRPGHGSGGFLCRAKSSSNSTVARSNGKTAQISVYGQESNPTTWKLAAMNMAIRGIDFNFGGAPGDTLLNDLHPDLRADFVMANPPFNMKEWWNEKLVSDLRWIAGTPPQGNANFAWLQHMLYHLAPLAAWPCCWPMAHEQQHQQRRRNPQAS